MISSFDEQMMREALSEAEAALRAGEIPVGAVVVLDGEIVARAHNERERTLDPTAHAEVLAVRRAARAVGSRRLGEATLYVTLEPCAMCSGAIVAARVGRLVFGAWDEQRGCAGSLYRLTEDPAFDWCCPAEGGVLAEECAALITRGAFSCAKEQPPPVGP